jgi:hypothetical protein
MKLSGSIISGEFDEFMNEFSIEQVKTFYTKSTLTENQLDAIYDYLHKHKDEGDGQILTLYDQLPVRLTQEETNQLLEDLNKIKTFYQ